MLSSNQKNHSGNIDMWCIYYQFGGWIVINCKIINVILKIFQQKNYKITFIIKDYFVNVTNTVQYNGRHFIKISLLLINFNWSLVSAV
jgi:6-phosphogluconate dehydrogenase